MSVWNGSVTVRASDLQLKGRGFDSQPFDFYININGFGQDVTSVSKH